MNMKFYKCYSINLCRFLKVNDVRYLSKGINEHTGRTYWVFLLDDKLSKLLTIWTQDKIAKDKLYN